MSLFQLEVFVCVAKHRHITHAAAELHISQPSVSRHLQLLEQEYRVKLIQRLSHGIALTPQGEKFLTGAQAVLAELYKLKDLMKPNGSGNHTLRVGTSFGPSISLVPKLLAAFKKAHPAIQLITKSAKSRTLERMLLADEIDVAVVTNASIVESLATTRCGTVEMVAFASAKRPLVKKTSVTADEIASLPMIVQTTDGSRPARTWEQYCKLLSPGVVPKVILDTDNHQLVRQTVLGGEGIGFGYRDLIASDIKQKSLAVLDVVGFSGHYPVDIIHHRDRPLSQAAKAFLALARERHADSKQDAR